MKYCLLLTLCVFIYASCCQNVDQVKEIEKKENYTHFSGGYNKSFNDTQELHIESAKRNGVGPLVTRSDTVLYAENLIRIPDELVIFKTDPLKYSIPYLVPKASKLLTDICINFHDSLVAKKMPLYKPIITSITRTDEDVRKLVRRNLNASDNSAHRFGTTFDISWSRFEKLDSTDSGEQSSGQLKLVLAEVLYDLKERKRCYIKHERKQACFHITVQ